MKAPATQEMQAFAKRARADIASAYLALPRIKKHGLTLDHPRAAKLARGEANRSARAEWGSGITMPQVDGRASVVDADTPTDDRPAMRVDETQLAERFRSKNTGEGNKKWAMALINADAGLTQYAPGQIDEADENEQRIKQMLALKHQIKPRDRRVLELRFEQGLSIAEIAVETGKTDKAIYACLKRLQPQLCGARERKEWGDAHNAMGRGTGDAPVVLQKTGQLGWELGVQQ